MRQVHDIDLKLLRCFCVIVEEGSFTAAQAALNLSQSALSEYLKSLELRLGVRLCQRGPKGFRLYPEGEIVYRAAKEVFASIDVFKLRSAELSDGAGYQLTVAVQDGIVENPQARIPEAIARFSEYYPNVGLTIEASCGFRILGRVADGALDIGIALMNDQFQNLAFEQLFVERAYLCCGNKHPLFDIADADLTRDLIETYSYCHRGRVEHIHPDPESGFPHRGDIGHGSEAHLALILSGRNIGYLPDYVAAPLSERKRLRILRPDLIQSETPVVAVTTKAGLGFRILRTFLDCLIDSQLETGPGRRKPARGELQLSVAD